MALRPGFVQKLTALVLSWVVPATSIWAAAPPPTPTPAPAKAAAAAPQPGPDLPSFGILVGQALSDATGLPIPGATVRLLGSAEAARPVDEDGRFGLPASPGARVLVAEKDGFVAVERSVTAVAGQGTAVLDARLTPLGTPTTIGSSGGTATAGSVTVTVGGGAVSQATGFIVTPLSGQGLPNRLPLGFAPVLGFDFRAGASVAGPFAVRLRDLPAAMSVHLVEYRAAEHSWYLTDASLTVDSGVANASLPGLGAYAVVTVDAGGPALPGPGAPLTGSDHVASPAGLTGTATVEPLKVPATGATARGHLTASSPLALPSGTVIQARLTESFTLGSVRIEDEPRLHDVVAYRSQPASGQTLKATIPLTAVHTFGSAEPVTGRLHLEFWTGRPSLAGSVGGGSEEVTVESGPARLVVAAGSLATDTAVSIQSVPLSAFLPTATGVTALGEVVVDLSGAVLSQSAELSLAASASGTLVIARVERLSGVPYVVVVSLAELQGGRVVSTGYPGLPGIVRGGRYVFYRLDAPIGFVAGLTSSPAGPVRAVVGTAGLPFVSVSSASGSYITAASAGASVEVTARVPGTPHQATATVAVTAGQTTTRNLALTAGLTTVETVPVDGATGVAVSVSVQLTASQPFDEATITAPHVRLIKGNPDSGPTVTTRRLLSADRKTLSIIPETPLEPATVYALRVTGLKDIHGGPVNVADVHFTTRADVTPEYDLGKVKFSFPDGDGMVTVSAANGSFPPGSTVMVVNERTGAVLTAMVGNEGELSGQQMQATLDDVMTVSLEDPQGNLVTARSSKYVDVATGRASVGTTGGVVEGTGGVELRLPAGAVDRGVVFKADFVNPASLPAAERPGLGEATLASAISIDAPSVPSFRKEVDLAFPKPADAPAGAIYYVVRRATGPEGRVVFQTLDTAAVQGDKVVTNSYPFPGYQSSLGSFAFGAGGGVAIEGVARNMAFLLWTFDQAVPGRARMGVITGRVTRNQWNAAARRWEYVPVLGAIVRRLVNGADPFQAPTPGTSFATTIADGTYVLFDTTFTGLGLMSVRATDPATGQEADATGWGVDVAERPVWAQSYTVMGTANVTFTASAAPRPEAAIRFLERTGEAWQFSDGLVVANQPFVIGVSVVNATLEEATLDGIRLSLREGGAEHLGLEQVADSSLDQTGVHTVAVRIRPISGSPVTETASFLVIAEGGDNNQVLPDRPPEIIVPRLVPQPDATAVSPGTFPEVAFTEPVTNLPGNVSLHELATDGTEGPALTIQLYGTGPQGAVSASAFGATSQVSLLTIRPSASLKYLTKYRLKLSGAIHDLDPGPAPDPKELAPFAMNFETFRSGLVGGTEETFHSAGILVLEDWAWLVQNNFMNGLLRTFDVSDPVEPKEVGTPVGIPGRPVDLAGETESTAIEGVHRLLVVGQTVTADSRPSNLHVFDVSGETPVRIGAASVSRDAVDGTLSRVEVRGRHAYTITWRKGVQVVDLLRAKENYDAEFAVMGHTVRLDQLLHQDHAGFGHDAVVQTIRVTKPHDGLPQQAPHWLLTDLKVGDYVYGGQAQPLVFVTGELGFAMVNPQLGNWTMPTSLQVGPNRLIFGYALALGHLDDKDIAVVVGRGYANHPVTGVGTLGPVLAVVNLTEILTPSEPPGPKVLSVLPLFGGAFTLATDPTDVILKDQLAIVAGERNAVVVDLTSLTQPQVTGQIEGIGGHLALTQDGIILSTAKSTMGGVSEFGGIRTSALGLTVLLPRPRPTLSRPLPPPPGGLAEEETVADIPIRPVVVPLNTEVRSARLEVRNGGVLAVATPVPVRVGRGQVTLARGFRRALDSMTTAVAEFVLGDGRLVRTPPRRVDIGRLRLRVDSNNDTIVALEGTDEDAEDAEAEAQGKAFVFWEGDAEADVERAAIDQATLSLRLRAPLASDQRIGLRMPNGRWDLHLKVMKRDFPTLVPSPPLGCAADEKLHFCYERGVQLQLMRNRTTDERWSPNPRPGAVFEIPNVLLSRAETQFLFRCPQMTDGPRACPGQTIEAGQILPDGSFEKLAEAKVDIRSFRHLASMVSLRSSPTPSGDADSPHHTIRSSAVALPGWPPEVPASAKELTILVHGFAVSQDLFTDVKSGTGWFERWAKRLYWVGHPILNAQGDAHVVGVTWPGDTPGPLIDLSYYPEDEFNALQGGIPLGSYIADFRRRDGARRVNIFAHSLGNILVNNALKEVRVPGSTVPVNYVMNEPALASEAFLAEYNPASPAALEVPGVAELLEHARRLGYPDPASGRPDPDTIWEEQEAEVEADRIRFSCRTSAPFPQPMASSYCQQFLADEMPPPDSCYCDKVSRYFGLREAVHNDLEPMRDAQGGHAQTPYFTKRWGKLPRNPDGSVPGAWTGFFLSNVGSDPNIRLFNTYNRTDSVLRIDAGFTSGYPPTVQGELRFHAWRIVETTEKPFSGVLQGLHELMLSLPPPQGNGPTARDAVEDQKWWTLKVDGWSQRYDGRSSRWRSTVDATTDQDAVWAGLSPADGTSRRRRTRDWAELAVWFPATSRAAGAGPVAGLANLPLGVVGLDGLPFQGRNVDFTSMGGDGGIAVFPLVDTSNISHSFMYWKPFNEVWKGYRVIRDIFRQ